jgi:hypothetical protein
MGSYDLGHVRVDQWRQRFHDPEVRSTRSSLIAKLPNQACNAKERLTRHCEQPPVLSLLLRIPWLGELVKAGRENEAPPSSELASIGAKVVDRLTSRLLILRLP